MRSPYDFFDRIVCINMKHRKDRYDGVNRVFAQIGIKNKVQFLHAEKALQGGMYGCFKSHINVIQDAYNSGISRLLVFEDDVYPTTSYSTYMINLGVEFMQSHVWDIFYYGYFPINESYDNIFLAKAETPHIINYRPNALHAYCVNRSGMKKILSMYKDVIGKIHVDEFFSSKLLGLQSFCIVPMLFEQHLCLSHDNQATKLSHMVARKMQCTVEKTRSIHMISLFLWLYKSIWWLLFSVILVFVMIAFCKIKS